MNTQLSTRKNYDYAIEVVKKVIHAWDPYCLLKTGSPEDEFDGETASVVRQIPRIKSEYDAAIKLVGSWRFWNSMLGSSSKIRRLVEAWRDEKILKDQTRARILLWKETEKGNVAAQKVLYESKKEESEQKKRKLVQNSKEEAEKAILSKSLARLQLVK